MKLKRMSLAMLRTCFRSGSPVARKQAWTLGACFSDQTNADVRRRLSLRKTWTRCAWTPRTLADISSSLHICMHLPMLAALSQDAKPGETSAEYSGWKARPAWVRLGERHDFLKIVGHG